ncbi:MAG TPA: sulfite exporter TauE/SafE family protein [Candidatus Deferrimicrobiaceae bacterium]|nr:sulfite exporter TauE/SafE family protein [Candidatus Deferrimicrobiaceae bacterium]
MWEILLPILGLLIGILAALTGVGGGSIIVPILSLLYAFDPANAVGTSLATIVFTAIAATVTYWRQNRIFIRTGVIVSFATAPGAVIGAYMTEIVSATVLGIAFSVFLIIVATKILTEILPRRRGKRNIDIEIQSSENDLFIYKRGRLYLAFALGFVSGVISGLLGVGGGIILVPLLIFILELDIHIAVATTMFTMIFTALAGVAQHFVLGNVNFEFALMLGVGSILGTQIGAYIYKRASNTLLRGVFAVILLAISVEMIVQFL